MEPDGVGRRVREARRRAGLTQREAAQLADLSLAGLRDVEQGRVTRPRESTLRRVADAVGLPHADVRELVRTDLSSGPRVRVDILGPLRVTVDGHAVGPRSQAQRVLLGLLALSPNATVGRETLVESVWEAQPPPTATESLQSRVSRLRRRLHPRRPVPQADTFPTLVSVDGGYRMVVPEDQLDHLVFRRLVAQARHARSTGDRLGAHGLYQRALELWRGAPLAGLDRLNSHPGVVTLTRQWHAVVVEYASNAAALGRNQDAVPLLLKVTDAEPLDEAAHAALMMALAGSGQQAAALSVFDTLRRRLADELGTGPGTELDQAHQRVLRQDVGARSEPVGARHQLPPDIAEFTGRSAELGALHDVLAGPPGSGPAIYRISGMGGVGKTRLAVHAAHRLLAAGHYADVQLYTDLGGRSSRPPADPATVLGSFLRMTGVPDDRLPRSLDGRAALYRDRLRGKNALVLLDNADSEEQVAPLLPDGPTNSALITSRRALAISGAHALTLGLFTPTDAQALLSAVAGGARAAAEPARAEAIAALCGRHPLAVALAARRLRNRPAWTMADVADRLATTADRIGELDMGGRLTTTFDLSYNALGADERRMFRLLALHPGPDVSEHTAAALAAVAPACAGSLLERLAREHFIVVGDRGRYLLPGLLAEYARRAVEREETESERETAVTRLLDYYLDTAASATARG
ncbi:BTAD domain-containing putative transcriptional regulator [Streptomonospora wellingtoniae]|uniref:BTAD domain-containing putative transcriptional regulator n=1 Tax=Streptomonospora wellingtoniae TaxID=3075544 RepID=A0ABU2KWA3_9ACTN|nr:BTAD domain-containing putative transcriptional regulator [Streptomonospora sp. DSM 45055]MDT0303586.1 BTAD domain-containing putative transcriptional regulator [Streptomonospora sp. DSM 45055]